jgi:hypothetical protein
MRGRTGGLAFLAVLGGLSFGILTTSLMPDRAHAQSAGSSSEAIQNQPLPPPPAQARPMCWGRTMRPRPAPIPRHRPRRKCPPPPRRRLSRHPPNGFRSSRRSSPSSTKFMAARAPSPPKQGCRSPAHLAAGRRRFPSSHRLPCDARLAARISRVDLQSRTGFVRYERSRDRHFGERLRLKHGFRYVHALV